MCSTRRGFGGVGVRPLRCAQDTAVGERRALPFAVCTGAPLLLDSYFFFCLFFFLFFFKHTSSFPEVLLCALSPWLRSRCVPARPEVPVCAVLPWALVLEMASCGECSSLACGGQAARVHTDADVPARLLCSPFCLTLTSLTVLLCRATEPCAESLAVLARLAAAPVAGYLFLSLPSVL